MAKVLDSISTSWRTGMFSNLLVRELAAVLLLKIVLLSVLWFAFFYNPEQPSLTAENIGQMIVPSLPQTHAEHQHHEKLP